MAHERHFPGHRRLPEREALQWPAPPTPVRRTSSGHDRARRACPAPRSRSAKPDVSGRAVDGRAQALGQPVGRGEGPEPDVDVDEIGVAPPDAVEALTEELPSPLLRAAPRCPPVRLPCPASRRTRFRASQEVVAGRPARSAHRAGSRAAVARSCVLARAPPSMLP